MRNTILVLHRWLGLSAGIVFAIASLTGGVLVFETELDAWLNRGRYPTTPGLIAPAVLDAALRDAAGGDEVLRVRWPTPRDPVFAAEIRTGGATRVLWLDPGTGTQIRPLHGGSRLVPAIRRVHTTLFAGFIGHWVVTISCMIALLGLITGAILWWPGLARFASGFAIRARRGAHILTYDLHQTLGILAFPLLIVLTATGVLIPFPDAAESIARSIVRSAAAPSAWESVPSDRGSGGARMQIDDLLEAAQRLTGNERSVPEAILFPADGDSAIDVRLRIRPPGQAGGVVRVLIDRNTGDVLQVRDPRALDPAARLGTIDVFNLHIGGVGGPFIRWLWFLACLIGALSLPTGAVVWWHKRTRKLEASTQRAARLGM